MQHFVKTQKANCKDVERRFEVLQDPFCTWDRETIANIFMACMVLHNMIIKNEHDDQVEGVELVIDIRFNWRLSFEMFRQGTKEIENANLHFKLHNDLIEYLWQLKEYQWKNAHILVLQFYQQDHWKQNGKWVLNSWFVLGLFGFGRIGILAWKCVIEKLGVE